MMEPPSSISGAADEISLKLVGGGVSDRMDQRMQLAVALLQRGEETVNVFIFRNITHVRFGAGKGQDEIFCFLLQPLILVGDGQLNAGGVQSLGNRPGDGALVRDPEDNGVAALKVRGHGFSLEWESITVDGVDLLPSRARSRIFNFRLPMFR